MRHECSLTDGSAYEDYAAKAYSAVKNSCNGDEDVATAVATMVLKRLIPLINTAFQCQLTGTRQHSQLTLLSHNVFTAKKRSREPFFNGGGESWSKIKFYHVTCTTR